MARSHYTLDTSSLIEGWQRLCPPDVFPGVWDALEELIDEGVVMASEEVLFELKRKEDALFDWAKSRRTMFEPHDSIIQSRVRDILANHPKLVDTRRSRSGADPFVVAVAIVYDCAVVTLEKPGRNPDKRPTIPDVCAAYGVRCLSLVELLREQRVVLRRS